MFCSFLNVSAPLQSTKDNQTPFTAFQFDEEDEPPAKKKAQVQIHKSAVSHKKYMYVLFKILPLFLYIFSFTDWHKVNVHVTCTKRRHLYKRKQAFISATVDNKKASIYTESQTSSEETYPSATS